MCDAPGTWARCTSRCTVGLALLAGGLLNANAPGTVRNLPRAREGKRAAQKVGTDPMGNEYAPRTHVSACGGRWASVPRLATAADGPLGFWRWGWGFKSGEGFTKQPLEDMTPFWQFWAHS